MRARIIRADRAAGLPTIRSFADAVRQDQRPREATAEPATTPPPARSATVELMEKLAQREAAIARHEDELAAAYRRGEEAGRAAAEAAFEEDSAAALTMLGEALRDARAELASALAAFDQLAVAIAVEAVDALCANAEHHRALLTDAIAAQIRGVETSAAFRLTVSRLDFPDTAEVRALADALAIDVGSVSVSDALERGRADIALSMGGIEIGMDTQWAALKAALAGAGTAGGAG